MSSALSAAHCVAHVVALNRLQARRADDTAPSLRASVATGFADTVPLWFRSEAFAEDVADHEAVGSGPGAALLNGPRRFTDSQVLTAGAAVLRQTLQALKLRLW